MSAVCCRRRRRLCLSISQLHWFYHPSVSKPAAISQHKKSRKMRKSFSEFLFFFLHIQNDFFLFLWTTKHSTLNAQQLKIIFHLPLTQLLVNVPVAPEDTGKKVKTIANKATHQQAGTGFRIQGYFVLDHFVMPTICCQYFANFFPPFLLFVRGSLVLVCLQLCSN